MLEKRQNFLFFLIVHMYLDITCLKLLSTKLHQIILNGKIICYFCRLETGWSEKLQKKMCINLKIQSMKIINFLLTL